MEKDFRHYMNRLEMVRVKLMLSHTEVLRVLNICYATYMRIRDENHGRPPSMKILRKIVQFVEEHE
jgi:hypothetical protein